MKQARFVQFADEGLMHLSNMDIESESAWFGSGNQESKRTLTDFLNNFVENAFIPTIFTDFKYVVSQHVSQKHS